MGTKSPAEFLAFIGRKYWATIGAQAKEEEDVGPINMLCVHGERKKCEGWWLVKFLGHEKTGWFSMEESSQAELCYSLLWAAPGNFPLCVCAGNMKKPMKWSGREATFTAGASCGHS